jgi:tetratricopeptide (TPR) repeat protein
MAFFENCFERAAAVAGGLVWAAFGEGGAEATVMAVVASAGLAAVVRDAVVRRGPEDERRLAQVRDRVRQDFAAWQQSEGLDDGALQAADDALRRWLTTCFVDRTELARTAVSASGFPEAATELVLRKLAEREPMFGTDAEPDLPRRFARTVVRAALLAAVDDADYFAKLEPHLLFAVAAGIGRVEEAQRSTDRKLDAMAARFDAHLHREAARTAAWRQLPDAPAHFIGRDALAQSLADQLSEAIRTAGRSASLCVIEGLGGIGKTALAIAVAKRLADEFNEFQLMIALGAYSAAPNSALAARDALLRRLMPGLDLPSGEGARRALYDQLFRADDGAARCGLLVIDDCPDEPTLDVLLPPVALPVIVTSRRALARGRSVPLGLLDDVSAVALVEAVCPSLSGSAEAGELAALCHGLPIALKSAAAQVRRTRRGPAAARQLAVQLRAAPLGTRGVASSDEDVRAVLGASLLQLSADQRRSLASLSVLDGSFDVDAACAVGECDTDTVDLMAELYLLEVVDGGARLAWHALLRALAGETLTAAGADSARERHARHYTAVAAGACAALLDGRGSVADGLRTLRREVDQVWAALAHLQSPAAMPAATCAMARALHPHMLRFTREWHEIDAWWRHAARCAQTVGDTEALGRAWWALGDSAFMQDDLPAARQWLDRAGQIFASDGEPSAARAWVMAADAEVSRMAGDMDRALRAGEGAVAAFRSLGHDAGEAAALTALGAVHHAQDRLQAAQACFDAAVALCRDADDRAGLANAFAGGAVTAYADDRLDDALALVPRVLDAARDSGNQLAELSALLTQGDVLHELGRDAEAGSAYQAALLLSRRTANRYCEAWALNGLASTSEDAASALERHNGALALMRATGIPSGEAVVLLEIAQRHMQLGDFVKAADHARDALALAERVGDLRNAAHGHFLVGELSAMRGDCESARTSWTQALGSARAAGDRWRIARILHALAALPDARDAEPPAVAMLDEAISLWRELGESDREGMSRELRAQLRDARA